MLVQEGVQYVAFFRSALEVALLVLREADKVHLSRDAAEVGDRRERTINGEAFMAHEDVVDSISSGNVKRAVQWVGALRFYHGGGASRKGAA